MDGGSGRPARAGVARLAERVAATGGCARPVRLAGWVDHVDVATGEARRVFDSAGEPGGVLRVRCDNRRATVCPACSALYKGDARKIILGGLVDGPAGGGRDQGGGDAGAGVSEVVGRPGLFVTVTAPSFGAVHSRRTREPVVPGGVAVGRVCRPRRGTCAHGRALGCAVRHREGDARLGEPLCVDCYDYAGQVVWNSLVPRLWKVTRDRLESALARSAGLPVAGLRRLVRLVFAKVAEMQARGVVHLHAVLRLDPVVPGHEVTVGGDDQAGGGGAAGDALGWLEGALRTVVGSVALPCPPPGGTGAATLDDALRPTAGVVRWGVQVDVRRVVTNGPVSAVRVANYIAKYATKSVEDGGGLARPVRRRADLDGLRLRPHVRRLVETCFALGDRPSFTAALGVAAGRVAGRRPSLHRWAHTLGFGGHWLTKSRSYSTTFGALRAARRHHARARRFPHGRPVDAFDRPDGHPGTVVVSRWAYAGSGHRTVAEAVLASAVAGVPPGGEANPGP